MTVKICLDPGHGGKDSGAVGFGICEKNVVLDLAKRVNRELGKYEGVVVYLTRSDDRFIELSARADYANTKGVDYFISLHNNAGSSSAHGFESYVYTSPSKASIDRQSILHAHVMKYLSKYGTFDRGKKRANFAVVRETKMPAILLENLFITNEKENKLLKDSAFLDGLAQAIAEGVADIFDLKAQPQPAQPKPQPSPAPEVVDMYDMSFLKGDELKGLQSSRHTEELVPDLKWAMESHAQFILIKRRDADLRYLRDALNKMFPNG